MRSSQITLGGLVPFTFEPKTKYARTHVFFFKDKIGLRFVRWEQPDSVSATSVGDVSKP